MTESTVHRIVLFLAGITAAVYVVDMLCPAGTKAAPVAQEVESITTDHTFVAWCDSIYHHNVSCPKHGQVEVPAEVLAEEEADDRRWCEHIGYGNPTCEKYLAPR